jgi:hypothetical protein
MVVEEEAAAGGASAERESKRKRKREWGKELSLSAGYRIVPWSTWAHWNFVRQNIFSSCPHSVSAALQRVLFITHSSFSLLQAYLLCNVTNANTMQYY